MAEFNFDNLSPEEKEQLAREAFKSKEKEFAKRAKEEQEAHYKQLKKDIGDILTEFSE